MLKSGEIIGGDFEILRLIGGGGMGAVYLAYQRSTDSQRALKVMLPEWTEHEQLVRRFEQEARACGKIESEHVVKILAYGVDSARHMPWLVMEYLPGETLEARVQRRGVPLPAERVALLEQLFHGISAAHRAGIVHRDLKPQNIYVATNHRADSPFTVKVLDFGIAKVVSGSNAATRAMGTRAWMAPEQEQARSVITPSADVWALGLVTFWLITGQSYWLHIDGRESDLSYEIYFDAIPAASVRARQLGLELPRALDDWFAACLTRDPAQRYKDAQACWDALSPRLRSPSTTAVDTTRPAAETPPATSAERSPGAGSSTTVPTSHESVHPTHSGSVSESRSRSRRGARAAALGAAAALWLGLVASALWFWGPRALSSFQSWTLTAQGPVSTSAPSRARGAAGAPLPTPLPSRVATAPTASASLPAAPSSAPAASAASPTPALAVPAGMVLVSPGSFSMGLDDGQQRHLPHRVTITQPFFIDSTETTVQQYRQCVAAGKCSPSSLHGREMDAATRSRFEPLCHRLDDVARQDHPVNCVDRTQAEVYCEAQAKRLPTEAEWEYAARGADGRVHPWGNEPTSSCHMAVLAGICPRGQTTQPVGSRSSSSASPFGALDMVGNVWEWVQDAWDEGAYARGPVSDPLVVGATTLGILRGGSWDYAPKRGAAAFRLPFRHGEGNVSTGFRCVRAVATEVKGP